MRLLALLLAFTAPLFAQAPVIYNGRPAAPEEILIRLRSNVPGALARIRNAAPSAAMEPLNPALGLHLVRERGKSLPALLQAFSNRPDVVYAEPNYVVQAVTTSPNDLSFSFLWGMTRIGAPSAWDITTGGTSAVVGIVDSGIDYTHPDLASNVWSAPSPFTVNIQGRLVTCPAGSHGFNALVFSCDPRDDYNHGSHVSGTIGADGNNSIGIAGVNWRARMMGLKFLNATGSGTVSDAINAIEFAIQVKSIFAGTSTPVDIRVLSNSWGGNDFSQSLLDEINKANSNEMLFVAAAGNASGNNDAVPFYPANYSSFTPNVIAVAATDGGDGLAGFSNYGPNTVQLGAPGVAIYSTIVGGNYATFDGTSVATPHVAGAALLTAAACPSLNTAALKNALLANVDPVPALSGRVTTEGRLNVNRALRSCSGGGTPKGTYLGTSGQDFVGRGGSLQSNGIPDWHIRLEGLRGIPARVRITSSGGLWEAPFNGQNWLVSAQYAGDGTGDLWFEPWSNPTSFHVTVWYPDSSTDEVDAVAGVASLLSANFLGATGQDFAGPGGSLAPNGIADWHIRLQGLRSTPAGVRITTSNGLWEAPFNGYNWLIATWYPGDGTGDLWFEPWSNPSSFHVTVWYSDGTSDQADAF